MEIQEVLKNYPFGEVSNLIQLNSGIIHNTWRLETTNDKYILQYVSSIFSEQVMEDIDTVLKYLRGQGFLMMEVVKTRQGHLFVADGKRFWRMYSFVPGRIYNNVDSPNKANSAGRLLGQVHTALNSGFSYTFKHRRDVKHNISMIYKHYLEASGQGQDTELDIFREPISCLPKLDLPQSLRNCYFHGDPKITNFIFSENDPNQAISMVDFDDCGNGASILYELGSAFRSWCSVVTDSERVFSLELFKAAIKGYFEGSKGFLTQEETALIPRAILLQTLQGVARYITDYYEDYYFQWDPARFDSRKAHNLYRAQMHYALYNDILSKQGIMEESIKEYLW
ncbi:MAG: phosphotransferase [Patescibacteria group bacterium]|nr:phosphotransferase [Patescibacteria group bacterium]